MRSRFRKVPVPLAIGALLAGSLSVIAAAPAAAAPTTVYDSIPAELPPSHGSYGFQTTTFDELGDHLVLGPGGRVVDTVEVGFTNWACENDFDPNGTGGWTAIPDEPCATTTPGASFVHPVTINLYDVDTSGAVPEVGGLIASVTEDVDVPFRPSADPENCENETQWWDAGTDTCHNGLMFTHTFDFSEHEAVLADDVIVSVEYNTQSHGNAPIGAPGPYNSFNVNVVADPPSVGTDADVDVMYIDSQNPAWYDDGGVGGVDVFRSATEYGSVAGMHFRITTDDELLSGPALTETVSQADVKPTENDDTYQEWHEGKAAPGYQVRENGLNLGVPTASTIIKGTDVLDSEITEADLRRFIAKASVEVTQGTVTFQVPVHFSNDGDPTDGFTTLRSISLPAGSHTFDLGDTWATTRAWGGYGVHEEAPLGDLISDLFEQYETVWLAGFGVQADTLAVVPSLTWDNTTYTFFQPEVAECAVIADGGDVSNLDSDGWTFGLTRSEGHVELVENGMRLWTDSWSNEAKAAAEFLVDVPLGELGEPEIDVTAQSGTIPPGIHLGVDFDDDSTVDGFLIGESAYNGDWWFDYGAQFVRDGAPNTGGGSGSPWHGTLGEWLVSFPEAQAKSVRISLGSGVLGDYVVHSATFGCAVYGFEYQSPAAPTATERVWEDDIRPDESTYPGWHEGYANAEQSYQVDQDGLHLGDPLHSQIINGFDEPMTDADLEALITGAGVVVADGSVTFQVPIFYGSGGEDGAPSFTTLRSLSLSAGEHEFSSVDRWVSSRALVDNDGNVVAAANSSAHVADLVDFFEAMGDVQVLAFGVQSDAAATVTSITFDGTEYVFDGDIEGSIPAITGTPVVGETLTAVPGDWTPAGVALGYEWRANGTPIAGATSATLELTADLVGANVVVAVTGSLEGYADVTKISNAVTVAPGTMTAGTVEVAGAVQIGSLLTATPSGFSPNPSSYTYQWFADDVAIPGADDATFTPTIAELGAEITVEVTGIRVGYTSATATGVAGTVGGSPVVLEAPSISGAPQVDQVLTADPGEWAPSGLTFTYQWRSNGAEIPGATGATFTPGAAQVGTTVTVTVTATPGSGTPSSATSAGVGPVLAGVLTAPTPTISGTPETGETLTAAPGTWGPAPVSLTYQWYAAGVAIPGATSSTLVLSGAYVGDTIRVDVTGSKAGYTTVIRPSALTSAVVPGDVVVTRLAGGTRYDTAVEISGEFAPGVERVYLASGEGYADALSAGPVAAHDGAPLLLTASNALPGVVAAEIERLDPDEVIIVGGTGAVSAAVANSVANLDGDPDVIRIGGSDRYATSRLLIDFGFGDDGADTAYIATGSGFPDALAAGPAAAHFGGPVVLVPGEGSSVDSPTLAMLTDLGVEQLRIAGGTGAVTAAIEQQLKAIFGSADVLRTSGANRYQTAVAINAAEFDAAPIAYLATGADFADALAGVALAGRDGAPLFTVPGTCVPEAVLDAFADLGTTSVVLLGGTGVLTTGVAQLQSCS